MSRVTEPEPWLRGALPGVPPHVAPAFFSFAQVREELTLYTNGIEEDQVWRLIEGKHSLGFHLKHIAGSVDRLTTYLSGGQLSPAQLDFLRHEHAPDCTLLALLDLVESSLRGAERQLVTIAPETLLEARQVGRKLLPTTVIGLLVHVCEHTQRHLGQAILIAKMLRHA